MTRWLDREKLAEHISVRVDELPRLAKRGLLPAPSYHLGPRSPRWDRLAVDQAFGVASAPEGPSLAEAILQEAEGRARRQANAR